MNSKLILLVGGLLSSLVVYICLTTQYKNLSEKKEFEQNIVQTQQDNKKIVKEMKAIKKIEPEKEIEEIKTIQKLENNLSNPDKVATNQEIKFEPYIYYIPNEQINLLLPTNINNSTKEFFDNICKDTTSCVKDIQYKDNALSPKWINIAHDVILFFKDNNITKATLTSKDEKLEINATFTNEKKYKNFQKSILSVIDEKFLTNNISLKKKETKTTDKIEEQNSNIIIDNNITNVSDINNTKKVEHRVNTSKIQKDINKILKKYPIYFRNSSSILTKRGKQTLWKIVKLLRKNKNIKFTILVTGHTNAVGDKKLNLILSQKRADTVKWYLKQRVPNIKSISAAGFGSSRPKYRKYPRSRKNRRVEIIIKKGIVND